MNLFQHCAFRSTGKEEEGLLDRGTSTLARLRWNRKERCSPARHGSLVYRLWEVSDLVALLEADERGLERAA